MSLDWSKNSLFAIFLSSMALIDSLKTFLICWCPKLILFLKPFRTPPPLLSIRGGILLENPDYSTQGLSILAIHPLRSLHSIFSPKAVLKWGPTCKNICYFYICTTHSLDDFSNHFVFWKACFWCWKVLIQEIVFVFFSQEN